MKPTIKYLFLVRVTVNGRSRPAYALAASGAPRGKRTKLSWFYTLSGSSAAKPTVERVVDTVGAYRTDEEFWELVENLQCLDDAGESLIDESDDDDDHEVA